jgi:flagellar basal body-associated protein FliL
MAEEEEKQEQPEPEERPEKEEPADEAPVKKAVPKKMVLIGAGALVLIVICAVVYLVVFAKSTEASPDEATEGEVSAAAEGEEQEEDDPRRSSRSSRSSRRGSDEEKPSTDIFFNEFPASVVNLGLSEKYDYIYLKYGITLELDADKVKTELGQKMPKLVSIVDSVMSGQQWDKIGNQRGREALAGEVVDALNEELETGEVIACYFNTFVAQ